MRQKNDRLSFFLTAALLLALACGLAGACVQTQVRGQYDVVFGKGR